MQLLQIPLLWIGEALGKSRETSPSHSIIGLSQTFLELIQFLTVNYTLGIESIRFHICPQNSA